MRIRWKASACPLYLSRGNRRLVALYILLSSLLLIISYLGGSVMSIDRRCLCSGRIY